MRHITIPTAAEVNALPEPMRDYIHQLETHDMDPQGDIRALWQAREQVRHLTAKLSTIGDGCSECGWNDTHSPQCCHAGTPAPPAVAVQAPAPSPAGVERAAIEQLITKWRTNAEAKIAVLKTYCYGRERDGEMLDEDIGHGLGECNVRKRCAAELEALLLAFPSGGEKVSGS